MNFAAQNESVLWAYDLFDGTDYVITLHFQNFLNVKNPAAIVFSTKFRFHCILPCLDFCWSTAIWL